MKKIFVFIIIIVTTSIFSCNRDELLPQHTQDLVNKAPVANAGFDQSIILPEDSVVLDGSLSIDPDGTITDYYWSKIGGPEFFMILNPSFAQTQVKNLVEGTYQFELTVTDNGGSKGRAMVEIIVFPGSITGCNGENRPLINVTLTQIGTLSESRLPNVASAGSKIVFAGGANRYSGGSWDIPLPTSAVDIFDVNSRTWTTAQLSEARDNIATATLGNKIFFAGGDNNYTYFDNVDIYDVSTNIWTVAHLSEARTDIAAAAVGNKVVFAGGTNNWMFGTRRVDIYDISTNTWATAELADAKFDINAVVDGNRIYFVGGADWDNVFRSIDIYDISNDNWSRSQLEEPYYTVTDVMVGNTNYWIYYSGTNQVKIKNMSTGTEAVGCVPYPYKEPVSINNDILFPGNYISGGGELVRKFAIYNIVTGQWSEGLFDQGVSSSAAIISVNNTVYLGGGSLGNHVYTNKVYALSW